jgi:hypothetical protein
MPGFLAPTKQKNHGKMAPEVSTGVGFHPLTWEKSRLLAKIAGIVLAVLVGPQFIGGRVALPFPEDSPWEVDMAWLVSGAAAAVLVSFACGIAWARFRRLIIVLGDRLELSAQGSAFRLRVRNDGFAKADVPVKITAFQGGSGDAALVRGWLPLTVYYFKPQTPMAAMPLEPGEEEMIDVLCVNGAGSNRTLAFFGRPGPSLSWDEYPAEQKQKSWFEVSVGPGREAERKWFSVTPDSSELGYHVKAEKPPALPSPSSWRRAVSGWLHSLPARWEELQARLRR